MKTRNKNKILQVLNFLFFFFSWKLYKVTSEGKVTPFYRNLKNCDHDF